MGFGEAGRISRILKVIREGVQVAQTILERMENNVLKWQRYALQLADKNRRK
jgi:hypothetical protein